MCEREREEEEKKRKSGFCAFASATADRRSSEGSFDDHDDGAPGRSIGREQRPWLNLRIEMTSFKLRMCWGVASIKLLKLLLLTGACRAALDEQTRKDTKAQNTNGNPIRLRSKILAVQAGPLNAGSVFVAQSVGTVRRIILEVGKYMHDVLTVDDVLAPF